MSNKYKEAGVNIHAGYESVNLMKKHISKTNNIGVMSNIGSFGGLFDLTKYNIKEPVLVSGTDGVGTKLLIAQMANYHDKIGIDLVAMCVNDIVTSGALPLFFLDYIATAQVNPQTIESIVKGISEGCIEAGCALIGGETAEMPDMYQENHYDLAGYATGVVDKSKIINNTKIEANYKVIGLPSSGIHSNGFSLVRKVFFKDNNYNLDDYLEELNSTLKEELLKPTKIYVKGVIELINNITVHSIAHITGGGFIENIPRSLPDDLGVNIYRDKLPKLPIFNLIQKLGKINELEMYNIFNMGIGMTLVIEDKDIDKAYEILEKHNYNPVTIGEITSTPGVHIL